MAVDHQARWLGPSGAGRGRQIGVGCASVPHAAIRKLLRAKARRCQGSLQKFQQETPFRNRMIARRHWGLLCLEDVKKNIFQICSEFGKQKSL
jgi:hypothetical protein